jgi:hypothetical protein
MLSVVLGFVMGDAVVGVGVGVTLLSVSVLDLSFC